MAAADARRQEVRAMREAGAQTSKPLRVGRLKRRADFVRVGKGKRWHMSVATVQVAAHAQGLPARSDEDVRIGFTLTRKVGGAVIRNRARRRLKEAVRLTDALPVVPGHDYVIVGRIDAISRPFDALQRDLVDAFRGLEAKASSIARPQRTRLAP